MKIERREGVKKVGNEEGQNNYGSKIRDRRKRKRWEEDGIKKKKNVVLKERRDTQKTGRTEGVEEGGAQTSLGERLGLSPIPLYL